MPTWKPSPTLRMALQPNTPRVIAARYRIEREIGHGGMGRVCVARDQKLNRLVAVKLIAEALAASPAAVRRFKREAQAAAKLRSAYIVEIYDYGVDEGAPFMVMELLEGEGLDQRLARLKRFELRETAVILEQMCRGLKAAHNAGLVHRDLKLGNVFLVRRDDGEVAKLLDFGIVKNSHDPAELSSEVTAEGTLLGTPQYMSPEQVRGAGQVDHRADLWATGVIAFRMLSGVSPFSGATVGDLVLKICSDALPRLSTHLPGAPPALDDFFMRAFGRNADDRFQTAEQFAGTFLAAARLSSPGLGLGDWTGPGMVNWATPRESTPGDIGDPRVSSSTPQARNSSSAPAQSVAIGKLNTMADPGGDRLNQAATSSTISGTQTPIDNRPSSRSRLRNLALAATIATLGIGAFWAYPTSSPDTSKAATTAAMAEPPASANEPGNAAVPAEFTASVPSAEPTGSVPSDVATVAPRAATPDRPATLTGGAGTRGASKATGTKPSPGGDKASPKKKPRWY
ncbi:MAG: serine/threonine protein kinase [Myxococcales bacterium]|nr:serine/threonine protein kinase [Myxococcales bacterium]